MYSFFRFPSTPHLAWLSPSEPREDKVLSETERRDFLSCILTVEEKIDGANVGISFCEKGELKAQNRGNYIDSGGQNHPQFNNLWPWIYERQHLFQAHLPKECIIFGEWTALKHSQFYTNLPDWFIGFDVYDRDVNRFYSVVKRNLLFEKLEITPVAKILAGKVSQEKVVSLLNTLKSVYGNPQVEGLYLRIDDGAWLDRRAKLVRPDFVQAIGVHWKKQRLVQNLKRSDTT